MAWWIHRGAQRRHEDLAGLAIQEAVDRDHAVEQLRHVQPPSLVLGVGRRRAAITVERVADVRNERSELTHVTDARGGDQLWLDVDDRRFAFRCAGVREHRPRVAV